MAARHAWTLLVALALSGCLGGWKPIGSPCRWEPDTIPHFAVSPDGHTVAVSYVGDGPYAALYLVDLAGTGPATLLLERPGSDLTSPAFSADGATLAFVETHYDGRERRGLVASRIDVEATSAIRSIPVSGGEVTTLLDAGGYVHALALAPDGKLYASQTGHRGVERGSCTFSGGAIVAVPQGGGASTVLAPESDVRRDALGILDGGAALLWQASGDAPGETALQRLDIATGNVSWVLRSPDPGPGTYQPCVAPDGTVVYTQKVGSGWQPRVLPSAEGDLTVPVVRGGAYGSCLAGTELVFLQDGRLMAMPLAGGPLRIAFLLEQTMLDVAA